MVPSSFYLAVLSSVVRVKPLKIGLLEVINKITCADLNAKQLGGCRETKLIFAKSRLNPTFFFF
ncbi:hypothetical protein STRMA_1175 [Streptococcus macacae NCTC 11558]|uniref:Uncharacterized protein n=1 Tax=Streptococcus macacae NCTC 11558 TaxID=764298 RepID=G5JW06_9STRE|nr:hypothetical protein STRMA_1175 [Streptococcus macacae NCTC 11558]